MTLPTATRSVGLAALLILGSLAGCLQTEESPAAPPSPEPDAVSIEADRPETEFGDVVTGPAVGPDLNATTAEAPRLVPGEWWRIKFDSDFLNQAPEFVRVVADVIPAKGSCDPAAPTPDECGGYVVGMPHEGWYKEAIAYHAPAFGDVNLDLSFNMHNIRFEPVRFPLTQGATWTTSFGGTELTATVESADDYTATIVFEAPPSDPQPTDPAMALLNPFGGDIGTMRLTYDARQHEVVKFESFIGTWEVIAHGYDFQGWVTVPRGLHTAIDYGQFLPATPGEPVVTRTQTVEGGYNRLTLMHGVFAMGPGAYRITSTAPDGTAYVTESVGGDQSFVLNFYEATDPDGEWKLEDVVGGPGATYTMGMAYHQFDIRLPDGMRRSDHSHPVIR